MKLPLTSVSLLVAFLMATPAYAATATASANDATTLERVRGAAMDSGYAYERLADLTDLIGPRLSGSLGAAAAVTQVADAMRKLGANVTLQPVKTPHWVRGEESGALVEYTGRPAGLSQKIVLTALGGSGATPQAGLTAPLLLVHGMEELEARAAEVRGRIVLIDVPFDQHLADRGLAGVAYGRGSRVRFNGPPRAAELGAAAVLVRSIGGADFRIPHTGASGLEAKARIPAAAVTVEDALLIGRLIARGPVSMRLTLTPQVQTEVDSFNVIADWPGTDKADEIVIVSGHLDSWDLATGAIDDGTGVASAMGVLETLKRLNLHARRTIRLVAWMNEENGGRGGSAYLEANKGRLEKQFAAIENDSGGGRPLGFTSSAPVSATKWMVPVQNALLGIGANAYRHQELLEEGDLWELEAQGVPSFAPLVDTSTYFHYHHTAADTLDKVNPDNLRRQVAVMSVLSWYLANMEPPIGRTPRQAD